MASSSGLNNKVRTFWGRLRKFLCASQKVLTLPRKNGAFKFKIPQKKEITRYWFYFFFLNHRLQDWQDSKVDSELDSKYEELEGGLRVPAKLWQSLYQYQRVAVQWLWELHQQDVGGILGDEMGLGKTVQMVTFLASLSYSSKKQRHCKLGPVLIVCPTTGKILSLKIGNLWDNLKLKRF